MLPSGILPEAEVLYFSGKIPDANQTYRGHPALIATGPIGFLFQRTSLKIQPLCNFVAYFF
jgi:hypothetical protein